MPNNLWRENLISSEIALNWEQFKAIFCTWFQIPNEILDKGILSEYIKQILKNRKLKRWLNDF